MAAASAPWSPFGGLLIETVARSAAQKAEQKAAKLAHRVIDLPLAETISFKARTAPPQTPSERDFSRLNDQAGGSTIRVRGPTKVMCHLMFGILAVTVDQLVCLVA